MYKLYIKLSYEYVCIVCMLYEYINIKYKDVNDNATICLIHKFEYVYIVYTEQIYVCNTNVIQLYVLYLFKTLSDVA